MHFIKVLAQFLCKVLFPLVSGIFIWFEFELDLIRGDYPLLNYDDMAFDKGITVA